LTNASELSVSFILIARHERDGYPELVADVDGRETSCTPACSAMGVAMPQILEFPRGAIVFDPEAIKIVAQALDDAWDEIEKSGSEFARPAYANATREEIAKHMLEVAGRGERDRHILAEDAVRFLAENYKY
jgi:hypothetical protein